MKNLVLINQSTNPELTTDHLLQLAAALSIQNQRDVVPHWDGHKDPSGNVIDAKITFSVAQADAGIPADAIPAITQDTLPDAPDDLGFHDVEENIEVVRLGLSPILANGGTLLVGANSWAVTGSHEAVEVDGDGDAAEWVTMPDGEDLAFEFGDPAEAFAYPIDVPAVGALPAGQVWVSDFVLPSYFVPGSPGPWTFLGNLTGPFTKGRACYQIIRSKAGVIRNEFGMEMPQWRRDVIEQKCRTPGTRHHKRHHGHKAPKLAPGESVVHNDHGYITCKADGTIVIRVHEASTTISSKHGSVTIDATGIHITAAEPAKETP